MRSTNNFKRMLSLLMVTAMIACLLAATAVQSSAAALGDAVVPASSDITLTVLIFVIIFLVLALAAVVVVVLVVTTRKQENHQGMNDGPNSMPSPAPTNAQSFNRVQSMGTPAPTAPFSRPLNAQPPVQQPVNLLNNAPVAAPPAAEEGAGDTTVLGAGSAGTGFVLKRKNGGEEIKINKSEFFIGKEKAKVDYCIVNNNSISRRHAKIKVRAGKCYISDLGSTNCTYINGTKLSPNQEIALIPGDVIKLSNEEFEFVG